VINTRSSLAGAVAALVLLVQPWPALAQQAQQGPGWFVPGQPRAAAPARPVRQSAPGVAPGVGNEEPAIAPATEPGAPSQQQIRVQLPEAPKIPPIPKGPPTPAAIIGVLSIPDVLRVSTAYQQADKVLTERHKKLADDAQREQATLRGMGQALANQRAKLSPEQIRQKERELQDRIANSRRSFGERNQVIQEAGQYVMAQINRTLEEVAQQVALSRGVNMMLNRAQVLGTTNDFDLTPEVAQVLNKVLPAVIIPPDGVSPLKMAAAKTEPSAPAEIAKSAAKAPVKH
jgi:Skp family chaperone for outer membrane proteins